jgi:hypothetical protein
MPKATRVHSTPPTNMSPTRRNILGTIAAAATAIAAKPVTAAAIGPIAADPIYEVIERHRKACAAHNEAINTHMAFEEADMQGEKLEKYSSLVAATAAAYDELEDAGLDLINNAGRYFCALPVHQTAIRRGRRAGPAGIYFVRRRQHRVPGGSIRLCDRPGG